MDPLLLSRLQFAAATIFHFIFVPLTLGLSVLVAIMETKYVKTGDETYRRMARFWGKLFLINVAVGVVTGLTLEFQFGTNWSRYSMYVGDIFGPILAIEATVAFFLESTFIAVWFFGWDKLSPKMHALSIWLVAIGASVSAFWILVANAWMQHPVGYRIVGEGAQAAARLTDFSDVFTQPYALHMFVHTLSAAFTLAGFFLMGVSAWHILRKNELQFFTRSFKYGLVFASIFGLLVVIHGHFNASSVAEYQPAKVAAMEAHWETTTEAPLKAFVIPDEANRRNSVEIGSVPGLLSLLSYHSTSAEVKGLNDPAFAIKDPKDPTRTIGWNTPPVALTFFAFRIMVALGFLMLLILLWGWWRRNRLTTSRKLLWAAIFAIPLPYIAIEMGWLLAEVGRQPWVVYGMIKTFDAVSPVSTAQVAFSLITMVLLYLVLGAIAIYLLFKFARKGPEPLTSTSSSGQVS
ncbi:MAG: cytochrome ubiquinol oxidase subunit I [Candidatus Brocadiia bacterium]